jgi:hypothetical protein
MTAAELMTKIESLANDKSHAAAMAMADALSALAPLVSQTDYCAFCDRVFGNWG